MPLISFICDNPKCNKKSEQYPSHYNRSTNHYCSKECFESVSSKNEYVNCSKCNNYLHKDKLADSGNFRNGKMRKRGWCKKCERKRMKNIHRKLRKEANLCYIASQHARDLNLSVQDLSNDHIKLQQVKVLFKRQLGLINSN